MSYRHLAVALLLGLSGCAAPSSKPTSTAATTPARSDWDGSWKGNVSRNSPVEIDVSGGKASRYSFRGTDYRVTDSSLSGETMTIRIIGGDFTTMVSTITLVRTAPGVADFTFSGFSNNRVTAKLTRT